MSDSQFEFVTNDADDLVGKIVRANALESEANIEEAIALYQEIAARDPSGNYGDVAREALNNLQQTSTPETNDSELGELEESFSWWEKLSIKAKTTFILIGVTLSSTLAVSSIAYVVADRTVAKEINLAEQAESYTLTKAIATFMHQRYGDIKVLANLEIIADPELRASKNLLQKRAILNKYAKAYGVYSSITAFDLQGNAIASSVKETPDNQKEQPWFQNILTFDRPYISQPLVSDSGTLEIHFAAPIKDTTSGKTMGMMLAKMPADKISQIMVNPNGVETSYLLNNRGQIFLSSDEAETQQISAIDTKTIPLASRFDFSEQLIQEFNRRANQRQNQAKNKQFVFNGKQEVAYFHTFSDLETKFLQDLPYLGWSTLTTIDNDFAFAAQRQLLLVFILGTVVTASVIAVLARLIAEKATQPLIDAAETVDKIGKGIFESRVRIQGKDEIADLGSNINKMAGQIQDILHTQEIEAKHQRQEKEKLQQGVMGLLLDVEGAKKGDLTVRAEMTDGAVGSIADAFNSTLQKLQGLLQEVQSVSTEVGQLSLAGESSVKQLSESALSQAEEINLTLNNIDQINRSVETVASYAQEAAQIARHGSIQAKEGDLAMDATVNSIEKIRTTVANTAKKVKQLAESSQEIAQIVEIISGISEKTNLLAFNASVEAARAGEHGEGFRIVAEEVRRLADRITEATKDIQQLVATIQQDTTSVLEGMETSTAEVVNGSELVRMTKLNLRSLAETSQQIDRYLKSISTNTIDQTNTSRQVNEKINGIALVAKTTSSEARTVVQSLRTLVEEAENLQSSISQFKL